MTWQRWIRSPECHIHEWLQQLRRIPLRVVRLRADTKVVCVQLQALASESGAHQPIPKTEEQLEVHIAGTAVFDVVIAVYRSPGEKPIKIADSNIDIAVLQQQLDGDRKSQ